MEDEGITRSGDFVAGYREERKEELVNKSSKYKTMDEGRQWGYVRRMEFNLTGRWSREY